jgi:hypothetical protein
VDRQGNGGVQSRTVLPTVAPARNWCTVWRAGWSKSCHCRWTPSRFMEQASGLGASSIRFPDVANADDRRVPFPKNMWHVDPDRNRVPVWEAAARRPAQPAAPAAGLFNDGGGVKHTKPGAFAPSRERKRADARWQGVIRSLLARRGLKQLSAACARAYGAPLATPPTRNGRG